MKHRLKTAQRRRRGATLVEMAVILMLFLTLVLGMVDLGLGVYRYHVVAEAARHGARQAIVHGKLAAPLGPWGPTAITGNGNSGHPLAQAVRPLLSGFDPNQVTIRAEWPDGGNDPMDENRVRVSVSSPYQPIVTFIFGRPTITLCSTSTMYIAH